MTDTAVVHKRQAAEIVEIKKGGRKRVEYEGSGRWINEAICAVMLTQPSKWYDIKELARLGFRSASTTNQQKARNRIPKLFHYMFQAHNRVLIREFERRIEDTRIDRVNHRTRKVPLKGRSILWRIKIAEVEDIDQARSELQALSAKKEVSQVELRDMLDSLKMLEAPKDSEAEASK
jgi:hypothetical protein